ncbi:putative FK506-binding protein 15 [Paratrimastix pyriformis]|uniref:peptidylprolyl isomerase n=1 Tax=Paratrimastix pyriformis TaxID=342808 RepID=A0ABQ8UDE8_9EUKA|nr:putative FK506-binding protein 15 [Paratrimastix pyriformis]
MVDRDLLFLDDKGQQGGSKLGEIFSDDAPGDTGGDAFQYKRPKQPKKVDTPAPATATAAAATPAAQKGADQIVHSARVDANKHNGVSYESQGTCGMALLTNPTQNTYNLLIYLPSNQPVCYTPVAYDFIFAIQSEVYGSFRDAGNVAWTCRFDSAAEATKFAEKIEEAKKSASVQSTDIEAGKSAFRVLPGDTLGVLFTGWLENPDGSKGAVFDSNATSPDLFKFVLGRGEVIKGWDMGLVGMRKEGITLKRVKKGPAHQKDEAPAAAPAAAAPTTPAAAPAAAPAPTPSAAPAPAPAAPAPAPAPAAEAPAPAAGSRPADNPATAPATAP